MKGRTPPWARDLFLFALRNLILYFFLVNSWLQLKEELDIFFQSGAFLIGAAAALWMEKGRLRFLPALIGAAALPVVLRAAFFLVFRLQRALAPGPHVDFLFMLFDKDFLPALVPFGVAWLFNFLALRTTAFAFIEVGLNSLLLVLVFWSQAGYKLSMYSHPSILAWLLAVFVVAELFVLLMLYGRVAHPRGEERGVPLRALLSFSWILLPMLLVLLFFLLGRYSEGAVMAGGGLMKPTLFRFDFSPFVKLESEIRTSDQEVLLFRTAGIADRWLLKRFVLSGYDPGRGFFMEKGKGIDEYPSTVPDSPVVFPDPGYRGRSKVDQEYFFLTLDPSSLISVDYPREVIPLKNWKASSFLRVYRVSSQASTSQSAASRVDRAPQMPVGLLSYYTAISTAFKNTTKIRDLAQEVTAGIGGYYRKVKAIENYLQNHYLYSLKPGIAEDGDQLSHFLFESKKGYCSYFAFAMALMCRSLGIPARVAVGFYVDPTMEVLNFYEVRAFQAHAWVEVYFGDLGWIEFDPTSNNLAPGEQFDFITGPDKEALARLIREILANQDTLSAEQAPPQVPSVTARLAGGIARVFWLLARLWYVTLPALYLLYLVSAKLLPSVPGLLSRRPGRRARALYRLSLVGLYGVGMKRRPAESLLEYARRIRAEKGIDIEGVMEEYLKAVFAESYGPRDLEGFTAARAACGASYRRKVHPALRALGILNPLAVVVMGGRAGSRLPEAPAGTTR